MTSIIASIFMLTLMKKILFTEWAVQKSVCKLCNLINFIVLHLMAPVKVF